MENSTLDFCQTIGDLVPLLFLALRLLLATLVLIIVYLVKCLSES